MISVRNLLQQLSGSKLLLLAIILPFLMVGCKAKQRGNTGSGNTTQTSKTQTTNPSGTRTGNKKVKVIDWTVTDPKKEIPIGAPTERKDCWQ